VDPKTTTADALLGLLSLGPMSGYQLRQLIDESIGNFWAESYGQIYPTLKKLVAEDMVTPKKEARGSRTERTLYALTEAGRQRVHTWLRIPAQRRPPRNELLLKLFFSGLVSAEVAIGQVETFRVEQQMRLQCYAGTEREMREKHAQHPQMPYWLMTLRYGVHEAEALLAWCDETVAALTQLKRVRGPSLVKGEVA
jgi:PadR family transcriptional regulator, regulatory protein AphA